MTLQARHYEIERIVAMPRADVWELLSNTDRFNRVIALPEVDFTPPADEDTALVREARAKFRKVLPLRWKEFPFQWIKGEEYAVLRVYNEGPLRRVFGGIRLADEAPDKTRLTVFAEFTPANTLGAALIPLLGKPTLDKTIAYCEKAVALRRIGKAQARPLNRVRTPIDETALRPLVERLQRAPVPQNLVPIILDYLREADDNEVAGLRPKLLARMWNVASNDVLRLCLHATKAGLLNLSWHEMCPNCRVSKADVASLSQLKNQVHCDLCGVDFEVNFDRYVELRFAVHPKIRAASPAVYCIGGPFLTPHILAQTPIEKGGAAQIKIPQLAEPLRLRVLRLNHILALRPGAAPEGAILRDEGWADGEIGAPPGATIGIHNHSTHDIVLALEKENWDDDAVTAAEVTTLQEFRDLFSSEVLAPGQSVGIENLTLFFSDLCDSTQLYETIGDAPAYGRVRRHFAWMFDIIAAHHGAVVKTIGDAVMAAFLSPEDALRASLEMQTRVGEFNATLPPGNSVSIKIGLHHGPAIAINQNERLDYFGRTVNLAARIQTASHGGDIVFSDEVALRVGVQDILEAAHVCPHDFQMNFKGILGEACLHRVSFC